MHTDAQSDQLNRSIQAKAFTTGQDVFFRQGAYVPGSSSGQELIAHELTHVVQQNGGTGSDIQRTIRATLPETEGGEDGPVNPEIERLCHDINKWVVGYNNTTVRKWGWGQKGYDDIRYSLNWLSLIERDIATLLQHPQCGRALERRATDILGECKWERKKISIKSEIQERLGIAERNQEFEVRNAGNTPD